MPPKVTMRFTVFSGTDLSNETFVAVGDRSAGGFYISFGTKTLDKVHQINLTEDELVEHIKSAKKVLVRARRINKQEQSSGR